MALPPKLTSTLLTVPADGIYLFVLTMEWEGVNNVTGRSVSALVTNHLVEVGTFV